MALKRDGKSAVNKADELFSENIKIPQVKEKKILTTFSIEPSFKSSLEDQFEEMGLGWASGLRFALKYFQKNFKFNTDDEMDS